MGEKVACWDKEGNVKMKAPVDARECVKRLGFTMEAPKNKDKKENKDKQDSKENKDSKDKKESEQKSDKKGWFKKD